MSEDLPPVENQKNEPPVFLRFSKIPATDNFPYFISGINIPAACTIPHESGLDIP
jgi:hypothetical protein